MQELKAPRDANGEVCGGLNQYVGSWALQNGFSVELHTSEFELLDLSWRELRREELIVRIKRVKDSSRVVPALGDEGTRLRLDAFLEFLELGGDLRVHPYLSSALIDSLLARAPLLASVAYSTLYGIGRTRSTGLRESVPDDVQGTVCTHAVVVVGTTANDEYLISDPYRSVEPLAIAKEQFVAALAAAQYCCESALLVLEPER